MIHLKISVLVRELLTYSITSKILILFLKFLLDCNKNILMYLKAIENNWLSIESYSFKAKQATKKEKLD